MAATPANGYEAAVQQVLGLVSATWKCQAYREEQGARINWRDKIEAGELTLPFAILTIGRMERAAGVGASDGNVFELNVTLTRVEAQVMSGDQTNAVMSRLVALWQSLYAPGVATNWQLSEDGTSFDTSRQSPVLSTILDGSAPLVGGELRVSLYVDLTP